MRYAPSQIELAKVLGVHRSTIARWLRTPGCPGSRSDGRLEIAPWKKWAATHARTAPLGTEARTLKAQLEEIQLKRLTHRLRVEQRQHVAVEGVAESADHLRREIERIVRQLHKVAPDLENRTKEEIETRLRAEEDRIIEQLFAIEP